MSASYNDWESDLSSIIEKTNQNLKLLRRIGEKRSDDVSVTGVPASLSRPSSSMRMDAGDLRTAVHHRYAAEDAAASYRPRVMSSTAGSSSRKLHDSRSMRTAAAPMREVNYDSDDLHSTRSVRRSASAKAPKPSAHAAPIRVHGTDMPSDVPSYVLEEMKKSLEVTIASRSGAFEKRLSDLRTDFTVLTTETTALSHKFGELRDAVATKLSSVPSVLQRLDEATDAITRLEKHSSALLGWKVSTDQDVFELSAKVKTLATLQDKMVALEGNLESLATALKNRPRPDDKIAALQDKLAALERQQASFVDLKTVESALAMRLPRELHDVESRVSQSIAFVTEKLEAKVQSLEKAVASQRAESIASLKSELVDDLQRLAASTLRKSDVAPLQHAQTQLRDDLAQLSSAVERHDKRTQDAKQTAAQLRDELSETKQELAKALSAQQTRASALLDDRFAQLSDAAKERVAKVEQQVAALSKKHKRTDDAARALQADVAKIQSDALAKQTARASSHEREHEALRLRLARSVAELETLSHAKTELERRYAKQEKQLATKLKALQAKAAASERAQETERQALVQRIQDESKALGDAQGKTALLETLLANEKRQHSEKSELVRATRQEMLALRQRMRTVESDAERARLKLSTELQAKQQQVETLQKKLARSDADAAKALDTAARDAAQLRRLKVGKEHELRLAKLRLEELERAATTAPPAASVETVVAKSALDDAESKRRELERLLLDAQLQVDELTQELEKTRQDHDAASVRRRVETAEQLETLTREYESKLAALRDAVAAKDEAMQRVRETLVDKSALDALDAELSALRDDKTALAAALDRAQRDHARAMREHETDARAAHAAEIESLTHTLEARVAELDDARAAVDQLKRTIAALEQELRHHATAHADEVAALTADLTESRATIASLTADVTTLRAERSQLERELERVESELETAMADADARSAAKDEELVAHEAAMQQEIAAVTRQLDDAESALAESKRADEANRQRLLDVAAAQEAVEASLKAEIDMLLLSLEHERASSCAREQELTATLASLKASADAHDASQAVVASVTESLKASEDREQALQRRIAAIVRDVATAASAFDGDAFAARAVSGAGADDALVGEALAHVSATHRSTVLALERLHADYELALAQTIDDASTIEDLEAQMKRSRAQVAELEAVVSELEAKLKDQYAQSAQRSDDLKREIEELQTQTATLERAVAAKTSECEAKQAALDRELESRAAQGDGLRADNAKLAAAMAAIRAAVERVEVSKARELDAMTSALTELETRATALTASLHTSASTALERDVLTTSHRECITLAQRIRSLEVELTKSASVVEWHDVRASVYDEEQRLDRLAQDRRRDAAKVAAAEDEVLRNADFLRALLALRGDGSGDGDWMRKYVASAPDMVERLKRLEAQVHDAVALASDHVLAARSSASVTAVESPLEVSGTSVQGPGRLERRLSGSCDGASDDLEASQDADALETESEQSMLESADESERLSESAADLDDSSLDVSAATDDDGRAASELIQPTPAHGDAVDASTTLLLGRAPRELLATGFARRETGVESASALHATEAAHERSSQNDSEREEEEEEEEDGAAADATDDDDGEAFGAAADAMARGLDTRGRESLECDLVASSSARTASPAVASDSREEHAPHDRASDSSPPSLAAADRGDDDLIDSGDESDEAQDVSDVAPSPVQERPVDDASRRLDGAVHDDAFDEASESDGELSQDAAETYALELALERQEVESERLARAIDDRPTLVASTSGPVAAHAPSSECDRDEDADELLAPMGETRSEDAHENEELEPTALDAHESDDENLSEFDHVPARGETSKYASASGGDESDCETELRQEKQGASALDSAASYARLCVEDDDDDDASDQETEAHESERLAPAESPRPDVAHQRKEEREDGCDELSESVDSAGEGLSLETSLDAARDWDQALESRSLAAEDADADVDDQDEHASALTSRSATRTQDEGAESDADDEDDASVDDKRAESAAQAQQSAGTADLETSFDSEDGASDVCAASHVHAERDALARELNEDGVGHESVDDSAHFDESADSEQLDRHLSDEMRLQPEVAIGSSLHTGGRATSSSGDEESGLEELTQRVTAASVASALQPSADQDDASDDELIDSDSDDDIDEDATADSQAADELPPTAPGKRHQVAGSSSALSHEDDDSDARSDVRAHEDGSDADEAKALAGHFSGMETASTASGHSQDDDSAPFYRAAPADSRVVAHEQRESDSDDDDDDTDEFAFDSRRLEPALPAAPTRLETNALAPLPSLSRFASGAGALKKALSAATRAYDDEDDDMDEVERLLAAQSLTRPSSSSLAPVAGSSASLGTKALGKAARSAFESSDDDGDDGDDNDEFQAPVSLADAHRELTAFRAREDDDSGGGAEGDDFEDHDLASSPRDEHDESFDGDNGRGRARAEPSARLERSGGAMETRGRAVDDAAESGDEAIDSSGESEDGDATRLSGMSSANRALSPATTGSSLSSRAQLSSLSLGRRVALEEDDDMDDVERLLLEQTSMRRPTNATPSDTRHDHRDADGDDDEFGDGEQLETSERELSASFDDHFTTEAVRAHAPDDSMSHDEEELRALARTLDQAPQRHDNDDHDAISDSSESESESEAVRVRESQPQRSLAPLGLGAARATVSRMRLEEDDDMDEVERLLHAQTSMKQATSASLAMRSATTRSGGNDDDDDEFGEASLEASASSAAHTRDGRSAEGDQAIDSDSDEESERQPPSRSGSLSSRNGDASAATRIPIMSGSTLVGRVASDAIPSMLASPAPLSASAEAVESEIQSQVAHLSRDQHDDDDDDDDAYLEESFDLEESLQDDDDDDRD